MKSLTKQNNRNDFLIEIKDLIAWCGVFAFLPPPLKWSTWCMQKKNDNIRSPSRQKMSHPYLACNCTIC